MDGIPVKRGAPMKRTAMVRGRRARALRDEPAITVFRETVVRRARGACERCDRECHDLEAHHLVNRARCVGWPMRHNPSINGAAVCFWCHRALDVEPHDVGGPLEKEARRAFAAFEKWRARG